MLIIASVNIRMMKWPCIQPSLAQYYTLNDKMSSIVYNDGSYLSLIIQIVQWKRLNYIDQMNPARHFDS